jgi:hypothetical protein
MNDISLGHIILFHKNQQQLFRLVETIQSENDCIVIHVCNNTHHSIIELIKNKFANSPNVIVFSSFKGNWGEIGIVKATIKSIKLIISKFPHVNYLNLLSAQDYPIKSIDDFKNHLQKMKGKAFMEYTILFPKRKEKETGHRWDNYDLQYRINDYYIRIFNKRISLQELCNKEYFALSKWEAIKHFFKYIIKLQKKERVSNEFFGFCIRIIGFSKRTTPKNMVFYGGSQWWTIPSELATEIIKNKKTEKTLIAFLKNSMLSDECFFQTFFIHLGHMDKIINNNLREIHFINDGRSHPKTFTQNDSAILSNSPNFFARKFDETVDHAIIDYLDRKIIRND